MFLNLRRLPGDEVPIAPVARERLPGDGVHTASFTLILLKATMEPSPSVSISPQFAISRTKGSSQTRLGQGFPPPHVAVVSCPPEFSLEEALMSAIVQESPPRIFPTALTATTFAPSPSRPSPPHPSMPKGLSSYTNSSKKKFRQMQHRHHRRELAKARRISDASQVPTRPNIYRKYLSHLGVCRTGWNTRDSPVVQTGYTGLRARKLACLDGDKSLECLRARGFRLLPWDGW